jgi:hypothetical protein
MRHPAPTVSPSELPDAQTLLAELGAVYSAVAFAEGEADPLSEHVATDGLDEDAIDEAIFAGMVALR